MTDLKLIALDEEDLGIVSAHLQDAIVRIGDLAYLPAERRFAMLLNRFDWATALGSRRRGHRRIRTALRFERVTAARLQNIDLTAKTRGLSLLAIGFDAETAPSGNLTLVFAGGGAIQLRVECIEGELRDLGGVWRTRRRPDHDADGALGPKKSNSAPETLQEVTSQTVELRSVEPRSVEPRSVELPTSE